MSARDAAVAEVLAALVADLGVQRATLRLLADNDVFPIAYEHCEPGASSIRDTPRLDMSRQPVVLRMQAGESQVVENDCAIASDDAGYQAMREMFGGMMAQIVTANRDEHGEIIGLLSVHDLTAPRQWTDTEAARARAAADRLRELVS